MKNRSVFQKLCEANNSLPVLLVQAQKYSACDAEEMKWMIGVLKDRKSEAARSRLVFVEGSDHSIHRTKRNEFAELVSSFIKEFK